MSKITLLLLLFVLSACFAMAGEEAPLLVGGNYNAPPYEFLNDDGEPTGFNVDLTRALARTIDLDIDIKLTTWGQTRKALTQGDIQLVQGMLFSPARTAIYDFSVPHSVVQQAIFMRRDDTPIENEEGLADKSILVMRGGLMHDYLLQKKLGRQVVAVDTLEDGLRQLASGDYDCALGGKLSGLYLIKERSLINLVVTGPTLQLSKLCYAAPKGSDELIARINEGLAILENTGELEQIREKWFGVLQEESQPLPLIARYAVILLGALLGGLLLVSLWSYSLRTTVRKRTADLAAEVDERNRVEKEQARLVAILESTPDLVVRADPAGALLYLNQSARELFGLQDETVTNTRSIWDFMTMECAAEAHKTGMLEVARSGLWSSEVIIRSGPNSLMPVSVILLGHFDAEGTLEYLSLVARDISERKSLEEQMQQQNEELRCQSEELKVNNEHIQEANEELFQTSERMRESEARYRHLVDTLPYGIEELDCSGQILFTNSAMYHLLGYAPGTLVGRHVWEFEIDEEQERSKRTLQYIFSEYPKPTVYYTKKKTSEGRIIDVQIDWNYRRAETGEIIGLISVVSNITDQRRAQIAQQESEARYRQLFESLNDAVMIFTVDAEGESSNFLEVNSAASRITGYPRKELLSMGPDDMDGNPEKTKQEVMNQLAQSGRAMVQTTVRQRTGMLVPVELHVSKVELGGEEAYLSVARDIRERLQVEKVEREAEQILLDVINATPDLIFIKSNKGARPFLSCNVAFANFIGKPLQEVVGATEEELWADNPAQARFFREQDDLTYQSGAPRTMEERIKVDDGSELLLETTRALLRDGDGEVTGIVGVSRDLTERNSLQEQFRQSEKMRAVGQLAGGIAHDFNNQLVAVIGYADMLRRRGDEESKEYAERIHRGAKRASDLVGQLLAFSRKGKRFATPVNMHEIVNEVVSLLEHSIDKRISIEKSLTSELCVVQGDPTQLQNVILNIALNARDAMPQGGTLYISSTYTHQSPDDAEGLWDLKPGAFVCIALQDTGTGMDQETLRRVFEPFFTTKKQGDGTGMGLASAFGTIRNHGGRITVQSEPGKGSSFHVYLPLMSADVPHLEEKPHDRPVYAPRLAHILLIDDEESVRVFVSDALSALGYKITTFASGVEGEQFYRAHRHEIDLVMLDMIMPEMDGETCFGKLKAVNPEVIVLLASGFALDGSTQRIIDRGAAGFIQKPFDISVLSHKLRDMLFEEEGE